jgi:hypothetical protein
MLLFIYFNFPLLGSRSPFIPYSIKFVQRGFTERAATGYLLGYQTIVRNSKQWPPERIYFLTGYHGRRTPHESEWLRTFSEVRKEGKMVEREGNKRWAQSLPSSTALTKPQAKRIDRRCCCNLGRKPPHHTVHHPVPSTVFCSWLRSYIVTTVHKYQLITTLNSRLLTAVRSVRSRGGEVVRE